MITTAVAMRVVHCVDMAFVAIWLCTLYSRISVTHNIGTRDVKTGTISILMNMYKRSPIFGYNGSKNTIMKDKMNHHLITQYLST